MNRHKEIMTGGLRQEVRREICVSPAGGRGFSVRLLSSYRRTVICLLVAWITVLPGCVLLQHKDVANNLLPTGQQPDKILYEKSIDAIDHGHYDVGRLTLQTLLNTYPDSEYLAKAKLAIANSYFKQGGTAGLTESESEYKDFITFFPTAPEAPMAQYRVAMAHFRQMGKPDRDLTQARLAQAEFKEFLLKYPDSPLMPRAKARLREVQQVLAQGEYDVAYFYFENHANPAARSRFQELVNDYPSFSQAGEACWYLAQTYERLKQPEKAIPYYDRILVDYPLSPMASPAKEQLAAMHQPIPQPTLDTLARAQADALDVTHLSLFQRMMGTLTSRPNLSATRHGPVILTNISNNPVVMAKNPQPSAGPASAIAVEPVGDSALKGGREIDPAEPNGNAANKKDSNDSKEKAQKGSDTNKKSAKVATTSKGETGPLHVFKRILKPF